LILLLLLLNKNELLFVFRVINILKWIYSKTE